MFLKSSVLVLRILKTHRVIFKEKKLTSIIIFPLLPVENSERIPIKPLLIGDILEFKK